MASLTMGWSLLGCAVLVGTAAAFQDPVYNHDGRRRALHWNLEEAIDRAHERELRHVHYPGEALTEYDHGLLMEH